MQEDNISYCSSSYDIYNPQFSSPNDSFDEKEVIGNNK
jgi:hypothetical protein